MEWLGYCWHQSSISTCSVPVIVLPAACSRESRPLTTQPSAVGAGRCRARVGEDARRPPARRDAADRRVVGVEDVDVRRRPGSPGRARTRAGRGPRSCGRSCSGRRRASGVGSVRLSKTLIRPLFSATKTRPSGEKRTTVGFVSPREDGRLLEAGRQRRRVRAAAPHSARAARTGTSASRLRRTVMRRNPTSEGLRPCVGAPQLAGRADWTCELGSADAAVRALDAPDRRARDHRARPERALGLVRLLDRHRLARRDGRARRRLALHRAPALQGHEHALRPGDRGDLRRASAAS